MSSDPSYIQNLQAQGNAQGLAKLRALFLSYQPTLLRFSKANAESQSLVCTEATVNIDDLTELLKPQLATLDELATEIDFIPSDLRSDASVASLVRSVESNATLRNAERCLVEIRNAINQATAHKMHSNLQHQAQQVAVAHVQALDSAMHQAAELNQRQTEESENVIADMCCQIREAIWGCSGASMDGLLKVLGEGFYDNAGYALVRQQQDRLNNLGNRLNDAWQIESGKKIRFMHLWASDIISEIPDIEQRYLQLCARAPKNSPSSYEKTLAGSALVLNRAKGVLEHCSRFI